MSSPPDGRLGWAPQESQPSRKELTWITEWKFPSHRRLSPRHSRGRSPHRSRTPRRSRSRNRRRPFLRRLPRPISRRSRRRESVAFDAGALRCSFHCRRRRGGVRDLGVLDELNVASVAGVDARRAPSSAGGDRRDRYPHAGRGSRGNPVGGSSACCALDVGCPTAPCPSPTRRTERHTVRDVPQVLEHARANDGHRSGHGSTGA